MKNRKNYQLAASFTLLIFVILGYTIKFYEQNILPIDTQIQSVIRGVRTPFLDAFFINFTSCFNQIQGGVLLILVCILLFLAKRKMEIVWLLTSTVILSVVANPLLKHIFQRERPSITHLVVETSFSFPSGHSVFATLFFGSFFFFFPLWIKDKMKMAQTICLFLLILVLISRIYVGVHYPSDVLGGFLLSTSWLLFTYPYFEEKRFVWRFKGLQK
ncbi:undecaprenyl-diphosphatase [Pilibacter termitis]|uniref:Undecaprenyl-diphosphatase n=1 Tax=Pilibacter termitis TaxID=263852 RepID=A0A1T4K1X0_9ENTE|nr:phosphatase PAP2 family protein [Pilibacter termitis]SJZ36431.1 undecaprenyl-diphosphatase [Pilibacter termitis]